MKLVLLLLWCLLLLGLSGGKGESWLYGFGDTGKGKLLDCSETTALSTPKLITSFSSNPVISLDEDLPNTLIKPLGGWSRYHSVFLMESGRVYVAGGNLNGQLGLNLSTSDDPLCTPSLIPTLLGVRIIDGSLTASGTHLLSSEGEVYSFGQYAGFGEDSTVNLLTPRKHSNLDGLKIDSIYNANFNTFVITSSDPEKNSNSSDQGKVYGWGFPHLLGINDSSTTLRTAPILISRLNLNNEKVKSLACGTGHTLALLESGLVLGFGSNFEFQLAPPPLNPEYFLTPLLLTLLEGFKNKISQITASRYTSYVITTERKLYTWGGSEYGDNMNQVENNITEYSRNLTFISKLYDPYPGDCFEVEEIQAGIAHYLIKSNFPQGKGTYLYSGGRNHLAQLGKGEISDTELQFTPILLSRFDSDFLQGETRIIDRIVTNKFHNFVTTRTRTELDDPKCHPEFNYCPENPEERKTSPLFKCKDCKYLVDSENQCLSCKVTAN